MDETPILVYEEPQMPNVFDVAKYILQKHPAITAMKLQKLVYYSQAWSLVWDEAPLFEEPIQAWANGPVVPELYKAHKGEFRVSQLNDGDSSNLKAVQKETLDAVLDFYAPMTSQELSDLTHAEDPWRLARVGLAEGQRGNREISLASMHEYYSSL